jgi:hypothetical protein
MDAIDELMEHIASRGPLSPMLRRIYAFHRSNREVLDFLVEALREVQAAGWIRASVQPLALRPMGSHTKISLTG